jgi:mycofactocin system glycosyltransferase
VTRPLQLPVGLPVVLDSAVQRFAADTVLLGGDPRRLLRLRPSRGLDLNPSASPAELPARRLVRTLVDGGVAHPRPHPEPVQDLTVIIPARDRTHELERCLASLGGDVPVVVVDDGSCDPAAVLAVCARHGAAVVAEGENRGPAAARNAGLAASSSGLVAFLDSDCVVTAGWLEGLVGHFRDPAVAAVAPRVRAAPGTTLLERYARARGPLDLGPREARVRPGGRVPYVPTAALVVRRAALDQVRCAGQPFDASLRYGEDVDLVWRLHDAGWSVRYDPRTVVEHSEPGRWFSWWVRKHRYGTSAAPLSVRHPDRLAPMVLASWPTAALALLVAGRPLAAGALCAVPAVRLHRRLRRAGLPARASAAVSVQTSTRNVVRTAAGVGGGGAVTTLPVLCLALAVRRTRPAAALLLIAPPLVEALARRPRIDPVTWTVLRVLDDLAYATGVWRGCWTGRTTSPLRPRRARPESS